MFFFPKDFMCPVLGAAKDRCRMGFTVLIVWAALWGKTEAVQPLARIEDVRRLSNEQAAAKLPLQLRGVVTSVNSLGDLTLQDDSAGIWIDFTTARRLKVWQGDDAISDNLQAGMEIEIVGISASGGFAPMVVPETMRILGIKPLPAPAPMVPSRFFSGAEDCQRVEARGVVQRVHPWLKGWILVIDANPGRFTTYVSYEVTGNPSALVDSEVRVRGVSVARFNLRGESTGSRLIASVPGDLVVEKPPPAPEAVPQVTLDRLLPFRVDPVGPHRVRVEGTVTYALPGKFFYLQENGRAVRVETNSKLELKPGDRVEAAGFVDIYRFIGTMADATVRKVGAGELSEPMVISLVDILAAHESVGKTSLAGMTQDYDGQLIRCRARLLAVESEPDGEANRTLTLAQPRHQGLGDFTFRAQLHDKQAQLLDSLQPGSELEITGLVLLEFAANELDNLSVKTIPVGLSLILRSRADVVVLQKPSWWTAQHFIVIFATALALLGGALLWSLQLKREVRRKTRQLKREKNARRDAAVEFTTTMRERNRLAANLHDTLPQSMSGIGLQLDACEITLRKLGIDSLPPLEVARRMVEYAIGELRGAVWEMRSLSLRGRSFTAALQAVVDQAASKHASSITVHTEGPLERIPDFVSGNLLLIVQEALRNAQQHGNSTHIAVEITTEGTGAPIYLKLRDDGCGFLPSGSRGPEQGHYGIVGMRERAERLGGSLQVQSSPGQGTLIIAEVRQHVEDDDWVDGNSLADPPMARAIRKR